MRSAKRANRSRRQAGLVMLELVIAIGMIVGALFPLAYSLIREQRVARAYYLRAVAIEIVDGEMELLLAGGWGSIAQGAHEYTVHGEAARNLPAGQFVVTRDGADLRLEWRPMKAGQGGPVWRAARCPPQNSDREGGR